MTEVLHMEILVITALMIMSFFAGHILRKFNIIWLPDSIVAVVFSMLMAVAWYKLPGVPSGLSFNNETFFLVILPFIIFESGFSAHRQSFFRNMGSILMYAIIGTFVASFGIGGFLYATVRARGAAYNFSFLDCMIVGAVMSSTDPVATLSIFSKLDLDRMTYSLVFGESMLNDAVSIVSFKTLVTFYSTAFSISTFFRAVGMFILIFTGAFLIGMLTAALVSFILRRTDIGRAHQPMEITCVVGGAYLSYFVSDFANLSGIVSIFFYGVASRHYTYYTLSEESQNGSHWIFEAIKEVAEMLVFVLLGVTILQDNLKYDFYLITMTCIGCLLSRAIGVLVLTFILNINRPESDRISLKSQVVVWNAGLRGAVAYALAVSHMMPKANMENTNLMITTVHASVLFTIFAHGLLTYPLVLLTGLAGSGTRQLSEPRPARQKIHSFWSRLDKNYIIPFISFPRHAPQPNAERRSNGNTNGLELDDRDTSVDMGGRMSYDNEADIFSSGDEKSDAPVRSRRRRRDSMETTEDDVTLRMDDEEAQHDDPDAAVVTLDLDAGYGAQTRRHGSTPTLNNSMEIAFPPPLSRSSTNVAKPSN